LSIVGIGTDIVSISRMAAIHNRFGARLVSRLLADAEQPAYRRIIAASSGPTPADAYLARRFAAKEAAAKALGCGIGAEAAFPELAVEHDNRGAPRLVFHGRAARRATQLGVTRAHLSISDERDQALAFVILEA
jgi:holo-[acyl-carrier protein] synthase